MTIAINSRINEVETLRSLGGALMVQDQTRGFAEKRQFRAYKQFSTNTAIKMVFAKPFYLTFQRLWTGAGAAVLTITTGSTEGGVWVDMPTKACKWLLDGPVAGSTTITTGGTITGGNEREVLESDSGTGGNANGNGADLAARRALPAGTYYFNIVVTGTTRGQYSLEWEEFV